MTINDFKIGEKLKCIKTRYIEGYHILNAEGETYTITEIQVDKTISITCELNFYCDGCKYKFGVNNIGFFQLEKYFNLHKKERELKLKKLTKCQ